MARDSMPPGTGSALVSVIGEVARQDDRSRATALALDDRVHVLQIRIDCAAVDLDRALTLARASGDWSDMRASALELAGTALRLVREIDTDRAPADDAPLRRLLQPDLDQPDERTEE